MWWQVEQNSQSHPTTDFYIQSVGANFRSASSELQIRINAANLGANFQC